MGLRIKYNTNFKTKLAGLPPDHVAISRENRNTLSIRDRFKLGGYVHRNKYRISDHGREVVMTKSLRSRRCEVLWFAPPFSLSLKFTQDVLWDSEGEFPKRT